MHGNKRGRMEEEVCKEIFRIPACRSIWTLGMFVVCLKLCKLFILFFWRTRSNRPLDDKCFFVNTVFEKIQWDSWILRAERNFIIWHVAIKNQMIFKWWWTSSWNERHLKLHFTNTSIDYVFLQEGIHKVWHSVTWEKGGLRRCDIACKIWKQLSTLQIKES